MADRTVDVIGFIVDVNPLVEVIGCKVVTDWMFDVVDCAVELVGNVEVSAVDWLLSRVGCKVNVVETKGGEVD